MTREELLRVSKPILFNTEMVRAILDDRKTATRRVVKKEKVDAVLSSDARKNNPDIPDKDFIKFLVNAPYHKGKTLYVRETWTQVKDIPQWEKYYRDGLLIRPDEYIYRADNMKVSGILPDIKWHPSLHMPKKFARIFLKVTDVRVERLRDVTIEGCEKEGCWCGNNGDIFGFMNLWNSTIKKSDRYLYGWDANPWVWVIGFERIFPED